MRNDSSVASVELREFKERNANVLIIQFPCRSIVVQRIHLRWLSARSIAKKRLNLCKRSKTVSGHLNFHAQSRLNRWNDWAIRSDNSIDLDHSLFSKFQVRQRNTTFGELSHLYGDIQALSTTVITIWYLNVWEVYSSDFRVSSEILCYPVTDGYSCQFDCKSENILQNLYLRRSILSWNYLRVGLSLRANK